MIETAEKNDPDDPDWVYNGAHYHINHKYGFGRVDAEAAVEAAKTWPFAGFEESRVGYGYPNLFIRDDSLIGVEDAINMPDDIKVEFVEVEFTSDHPNWGELEVILTSPQGTESVLAEEHPTVAGTYKNWRFGSVRHFGEDSGGDWSLRVRDLRGNYSYVQ